MIRRSRTRRWLVVAIVITLGSGLFWTALRHLDIAALDAAVGKAAQQRELTP